ncbi:methylmalonyl-CoA mutase [Mariniflexile fucanivorans]|uniref:methylmalonyl-CoA mutase n=1 Tax=Mariniflexile fucanivorans TaxID=264023 RepID=A0A4R1RLL9_9FLAO|nr:methylmalonyl-CoA mutase [Mariniflexile fucanivorans]
MKIEMSRKNLQHIVLKTEVESQKTELSETFTTSEGIAIKSTYSKEDIEHLEHLHFAAGIAPNLRGSYSTMYVQKPWNIKQYEGFYTVDESNASYKRHLEVGQKELFVAFDVATYRSYDSDHKVDIGDIEKVHGSMDSVEDMKLLFDQIPMDKMSISITLNDNILPIMAFYMVAAEEQDVKLEQLSGTIQNDVLKEFMVKNNYIYPPKASMKIITEIFEYTSKHMPKFSSISISGYHMQEAGATCDMELAYTLAHGLECIRKGLKAGMDIDSLAPRLSFFWAIGMNHFMEIAKMRAARMLWAKLVKQFHPKNEKSLILRTHCQTSGSSLKKQDPFNNMARTTVEASSAVFGGTQSLHTNTLDEAMALPTDFSTRMALNTQLFLQEETQITKTVDPWAGSFYVEKLTHDIAQKAWILIEEIETFGGMTKAIEAGIPQKHIEQAATKKQARIDSYQDIIVGVNKFNLKKEDTITTLGVDNETVRKQQMERLNKIKAERNSEKVKDALLKLKEAAKFSLNLNNSGSDKHKAKELSGSQQDGSKNLLVFAMEAARQRATLEEISDTLETVFGSYKAEIK